MVSGTADLVVEDGGIGIHSAPVTSSDLYVRSVDTNTDANMVIEVSTGVRWWISADKSLGKLLIGGDGGSRPADSAFPLTIQGDQKVGINTNTPGTLLDVQGAAGAAGITTLSTAELTVVDGDILGSIYAQAPLESSGTDAILVSAAIDFEASATFAADNDSTDIVFRTAQSETATEKMRITSGGNVGIGASSPQSTLDVAGAITADTYNFAADGQADDDYEIALPGISALTTGLMVTWTATTANTGGATLEITSVGDLDAILKLSDQALATGDIEAGQVVVTVWDGANWQMTSQLAQ